MAAIWPACDCDEDQIRMPLDVIGGDDDASPFAARDTATLVLSLPRGYPLDDAPTMVVEYATLERVRGDVKARLEGAVADALESSIGDASTFAAVSAWNDAMEKEAAAAAAAEAEARRVIVADAAETKLAAAVSGLGPVVLARRLIYSHHIIAPSKRAGLRELSVGLGVGNG